MTVSNRVLITLAAALRHRRAGRGTRWRRLAVGEQALLVVAHLREGETYADLAIGFAVGTTTVFRYIREALDVLAAMAPTLTGAIEVACRKAFVTRPTRSAAPPAATRRHSAATCATATATASSTPAPAPSTSPSPNSGRAATSPTGSSSAVAGRSGR